MPKAPNATAEPSRRLVAVLAYDGVSTFELGIAVEIFGLRSMGRDWYRVLVCSDRPGKALSANGGVNIVTSADLKALSRAGTIIVPGWENIDDTPPEALLDALREAHANGKRIASIRSGVLVLAAAGLPDGRRAAVHWANADALSRKYPHVTVDANVLYVDEGNILTSAGCAAGLDL
jgi:AraC family transcriptional regulator, transcriptional activator FtrA